MADGLLTISVSPSLINARRNDATSSPITLNRNTRPGTVTGSRDRLFPSVSTSVRFQPILGSDAVEVSILSWFVFSYFVVRCYFSKLSDEDAVKERKGLWRHLARHCHVLLCLHTMHLTRHDVSSEDEVLETALDMAR